MILRFARFAALFFLACGSCTGGQQAAIQKQEGAAQGAPDEQRALAIDQIKETVVFFQTSYLESGQRKAWSGTGFFIHAVDPRIPGRGCVWLVTNKHMLHPPDRPYFDAVVVRANTKELGPQGEHYVDLTLPVKDNAGALYWITDPDDETVDLALFRLLPDESKLDVRWISVDSFATKEVFTKLRINENDEVLFAGLFTAYPGAKRNFPIVRHGKIALVTDERVPTNPRDPRQTVELILAEVTSFGGNSGSPVFARIGGVREGAATASLGGYSYYLLGVMQGFFLERSDIVLELTTTIQGSVGQNSGIAGVVPADKILRILATRHARAMTDLAVAGVFRNEGRFAEAEQLYEAAIAALETAAGKGHPHVAAALEEYALFLRKTGRYGEAKRAESRAKLIWEKAGQPAVRP
jgi:hypothetical protein